MTMDSEVPARWEGINGGPYINADDLLEFMRHTNNFGSATLQGWIMSAKSSRLDEVAAVFSAADVPALQRDLIALRDELEEAP